MIKLIIPSQKKEYIYQGEIDALTYDGLVSFACTTLQIPIRALQFVFQFNDQPIHFWEAQNFELVKSIVKESPTQTMEVTLVEQYIQLLPVHNVMCSNCRVTPMHGTRYKCYVCRNLNFCQSCFVHHNHPMIMTNDPAALETPAEKLEHLGRNCVSFVTSGCNRFMEFMKKKIEERRQLKELKQKQDEKLITEKLLKLPQIYEQDPQKYEEIVKLGSKMKMKDLVKYIE